MGGASNGPRKWEQSRLRLGPLAPRPRGEASKRLSFFLGFWCCAETLNRNGKDWCRHTGNSMSSKRERIL